MNVRLSKSELSVLRVLQEDGRIPIKEIANMVELTPSACSKIVAKLLKQGVIRKFSIQLDYYSLGFDFLAFVVVKLRHSQKRFDDESMPFLRTRGVLEMHKIFGEFDLLLKIRTRTTGDLQRLMEEIYAIDGVTEVVTTVVSATVWEDANIDIKSPDQRE